MKNFKHKVSSTGQSTKDVKKSQKHDANLQKNSTLYFQIGLILCLLATYSLFEMQFVDKQLAVVVQDSVDEYILETPLEFRVKPVKTKEIRPQKTKRIIDVVKVVDDIPQKLEKELFTEPEPTIIDKPLVNISDVPNVEPPVDQVVIIDFVQKMPIYPGCERFKTNKKRKKCMSTKLNKLINRTFNTDLASDYGLSGRQKIYATFIIDKTGNVSKITARAPHAALEKEAQRVINKIPEMQPGIQQNKPVGVIYTLPIVFDVRD